MVSLRNINLRSPSECQYVLTPGKDTGYMHYTRTLGQRFLAVEDREGSMAGPSRRTYLH